jgi:acyl-CoA dehydrogenase
MPDLDPATRDALLVTLRRFVDERLIPLEAEVDRTDRMPEAVIAEMRALGLFGLTIPEDYGGLGLTAPDEIAVAFELGRAAPAFRSVFGTNIGIGAQGLILDGTEAQKRRYLPRLATGELVASFALTEPEAGSDAAALRTLAVREGDGWRLTGTKRYITNAPRAGLFTVFARTDEGDRGPGGISAFLVEAGTPGLAVGPPWRKMGQHGAPVADVTLDGVYVPDTQRLGAEGQGFRTAMKVLDRGRLHIAAVCAGLAGRLIDEALAHAAARRQFGRPIAEFQLVQAMLADSAAEAYAARCMVEETARRLDAGRPVTLEASACKMFASEALGRIADRAVQVHGGAGYIEDHAVARLYRDVRLFRLYEGTTQIQQLVIARELLRGSGR